MSAAVVTPEQLEIVKNRARSVGEMFYNRVKESPNHEAYRYPDENEKWQSLTWAETGTRVDHLAAGLVSLGIEAEQRVAIASGTRLEWILADLAINAAGAATTTVYPSTMSDDVAYILADSDSRIVFAEDDDQVAKLREKHSELPSIVKVVVFDGTPDGDWVIGLDELETARRDLPEEQPEDHRAARGRDDWRLAGNVDLHVRYDGTPQGRAPQPRRLDVRRRRHGRRRLPEHGRPAVPVAADGALVRQGAPDDPARDRLRHGDRRSRAARSSTTSRS